MQENSFIKLFEKSVKENWSSYAVTEFNHKDRTYSELAYDIKKFHYIWTRLGLQRGDKIGICANSCYEWIAIFMAAVTNGYVVVILQPNISSDIITSCRAHSDCKLLYVEKGILPMMPKEQDTLIIGIETSINTCMQDSSLEYLTSAEEYSVLWPSINSDDVSYLEGDPDDICAIIYTSGSSGNPKGAMLSIRYFDANRQKLLSRFIHRKNESDVCINPIYHIFAIGGDILAALVSGMRLIIFPKLSPSIILEALIEYKPHKVFAVPMFLYAILQQVIGADEYNAFKNGDDSILNKDQEYYDLILHKMQSLLGGNVDVFLTGGVAIDHRIEKLLVEKIGFPLSLVYGLTESGPISFSVVGKHKVFSSGKVVLEHKVRVASESPSLIAGEIQIKDNIFSGYYKDSIGSANAFTEDGWFRSGDLGTIDDDGNIYIAGRCKNLLLLSGGENIYPEDIEAVLNRSVYIIESIVYQEDNQIFAIIYPDYQKALTDGMTSDNLQREIDKAIVNANKYIPGYSVISSYRTISVPFEKNSKGMIKRHLYLMK